MVILKPDANREGGTMIMVSFPVLELLARPHWKDTERSFKKEHLVPAL